jgi:flagellar biosynthesis protein FliQ
MAIPPKTAWVIRVLLAAVSVSLAIWVFISIFHAFRSTPDQIKLVNYDDYVVKAFDLVKQDVERFFQMGVLVLGGIWALAVVDKDQRVTLTDVPELLMFIVVTALFLLSFYFLQEYDEIVKQVVWDVRALTGDAGQKMFPDILNSPYLNLHYTVVVRCFYSGLVASGLTALSLCWLR